MFGDIGNGFWSLLWLIQVNESNLMLAKIDIKAAVLGEGTQADRMAVKRLGDFPRTPVKTELALILGLARLPLDSAGCGGAELR